MKPRSPLPSAGPANTGAPMTTGTLPQVDVVIVNWNTRDLLADCIGSLTQLAGERCSLGRVVVVDNASHDDSLTRIKAVKGVDRLPLEIIQNSENRGFAQACNQGARVGRAPYVLFLNPDTRVSPRALDAPVAFFEDPENAQVGICGIEMVDRTGTVSGSFRFPTVRTFFGQMTHLSALLPEVFPPHQMTVDEIRGGKPVDQVIGAFFLVRRSLFTLLDGFDERFFVYFEEVDFAYRAKQKGMLSYYLPGASVYHEGGGSTNVVRARRLFLALRSRLQYIYKHYGPLDAGLLALLTLTLELTARLMLAAGRRSPSAAFETLSAYVQLCRAGLGAVGAKLRPLRTRTNG